ncbi:MAG: Helicase associated domain protein, partial [Bacteroidota bacterium]|nr:Helicase associated domain protein [Bacteroidota bacterium]
MSQETSVAENYAKELLSKPFSWEQIAAYIFDEEMLRYILMEAYRGNGFAVRCVESRDQQAFDILISSIDNPTNVFLIVTILIRERPLVFNEVKTKLHELENIKSNTYHCNQYAIISPSGFEQKCLKLKAFNLLLLDVQYIKELLKSYNASNIREPQIQLFAHNQNTFERTLNLFKTHSKIAVVQATGTGKSFLIAKLLFHFKNSKRLVLAPSHYIIDQIKVHIAWDSPQIQFMTYAYLMNRSEEELRELNFNFIVLDEFHRCGAEEWGKGVLELLSAFPRAKVLGTSATPIRYLDGGRDMSMEIFDGIVAENLSLPQAIVKKILPMPVYVSALYSLKEETENLKIKIATGDNTFLEKENLLNKLLSTNLNWERTKGIPAILQKYIHKERTKFIVFCKEQDHIAEMEQVVKAWFKQAFPEVGVKTYRVISADPNRNENLSNFVKANGLNEFHLLFSIDMLNEGLHIESVSGVILLRPTESPTIFYQQIGRCLKVGFKGSPLILDFVNNFRSIRSNDFLKGLEFYKDQEKNLRFELGLEEVCPPFTLIDEAKDITEIFKNIHQYADNWEVYFSRLLIFKEQFGHTKVPYIYKNDQKLANWVLQQRSNRFDMIPEQRDRLNEIGFVWSIFEDSWQEQFNALCAYKVKYGHCNLQRGENASIYNWIKVQRKNFRLGKVTKIRIDLLKGIGFSFDPDNEEWEDYFKQYEAFLGSGLSEKDLTNPAHKKLYNWIKLQRLRKRRNLTQILTNERIERLNQLGMMWNPDQDVYEQFFNKLIQYKARFGDCNVPANWPEDKALATWLVNLRIRKRANKLSKEKVDRLNTIGIEWDRKDKILKELWALKYAELIAFKKMNGHLQLPGNSELSHWLSKQRTFFKNGTLNPIHKAKLDKVGVAWEVASPYIWERNFQKLIRFKEVNGHCNVPKKEGSLADWVLNQRSYFKRRVLDQEKIKRLEEIGFVWNYREIELDLILEKNLKLLEAFKCEFGHVDVSNSRGKYKTLYSFLRSQRAQYAKGTLRPRNIEALEKLGIKWVPDDLLANKWQSNFEKLKTFKEQYGHCNVKLGMNVEYDDIHVWISNLKLRYKQGLMPEDRIKLLEGIGFEWSLAYQDQKFWEERIADLIVFKERYGHCQVPQDYAE